MSEKTNLIGELEALQRKAKKELAALENPAALQAWKRTYLGRSSPVMQIFKRLPEAPKEERPKIGQFANKIKNELEAQFNKREAAMHQQALSANLQEERLDVTLPGRQPARGGLHIATQILREIYSIFAETPGIFPLRLTSACMIPVQELFFWTAGMTRRRAGRSEKF